MKQSLDLRLGQHLTITPQLQQAIRLLQLSTVELQQEIREALDTNPLLEEAGEDGEPRSEGAADDEEAATAESTTEAEPDDPTDLDMEANGAETPADSEWEDSFDSGIATISRTDGERPDIDARNTRPQTLRDHLLWQMQMTSFSETDRRIAESLIDAINEDGYLTSKIEEAQQILARAADGAAGLDVEIDEIAAVLHQIQNFDPVGVGARDLAECLRLQLKALPPETASLAEAIELATTEHLALLGARDYNQLRRRMKVSPETLHQAVQLIQRLNPRPGGTVQSTASNYIAPISSCVSFAAYGAPI